MNKRKIRKMFSKPEKDFNTWAREHNIEVREAQPKLKERNRRVSFRRFAFVLAPVAVVFAIMIPIISHLFSSGGSDPINPITPNNPVAPVEPDIPVIPDIPVVPSEPPSLPKYSWNEVLRRDSSIEELISTENLIVFNFEDAELDQLNKLSAIDNEELLLGFNIIDAYIPIQSGNEFFVVRLTCTIRIYENYEFSTLPFFTELDNNYQVNEYGIDYKMNSNGGVAYFKDTYEYFIQAFEVEGFAKLDEARFKIFLEHLLKQ